MPKLRGAAVYLFTQWKYSPAALYACTFCMAAAVSMLGAAWPWRIMALGGDKIAVGASGGILMGVYIFSCILIRPHMDRLGVKRLVIASTFLIAVNCVLLAVATTVTMILTVISFHAVIMGAFWSPLMGWLSGDQEGKHLNRRLGRFNFSWAVGNIVGASLGGPFVNIRPWLPFLTACAVCLFLCVLAAVVHQKPHVPVPEERTKEPYTDQLIPYRWMSRVALLVSCIALGLLRAPLASLFEELTASISKGADVNSLVLGFSGGMQMFTFFLLGKSERWHYHLGWLLGIQILGVILLAGVGLAGSVWPAGFCAAAAMISTSYLYSSHVYYTLSGGMERSAGMALHEIVLAIGITIGSFGGGLVGQWYGLRWAYTMSAAVWAAGLLMQIGMYLRWKSRSPVHQTNG
ncbi:MAG: MFS transporter [Phycisphaerae bacterium]|nr:MFS transporter [Phycisphaerae bacterium]